MISVLIILGFIWVAARRSLFRRYDASKMTYLRLNQARAPLVAKVRQAPYSGFSLIDGLLAMGYCYVS